MKEEISRNIVLKLREKSSRIENCVKLTRNREEMRGILGIFCALLRPIRFFAHSTDYLSVVNFSKTCQIPRDSSPFQVFVSLEIDDGDKKQIYLPSFTLLSACNMFYLQT